MVKLIGRRKRWAGAPDRHAWRHAELQVRPVSVNTARDPRYRREHAGGYGATAPYLPHRLGRTRKACKPIAGQSRTSVTFRQLRRAGYAVRQAAGLLHAVPVDAELVDRIGSGPIEIGRHVA